ncbi:FAD-dependent oxidoreductase [Myxosarcina sp. GI1(2024)]
MLKGINRRSVGIFAKLYGFLGKFWQRGLFYKLRYSLSKRELVNPVGLLESNPPVNLQVDRSESIVVVGVGIASYTLVRSLHRLGYQNVKIVARDCAFGGKCVNIGCMPSEYYTAYRQQGAAAIERGKQFVSSLRQFTQQSFQELGYPLIEGEVVEVRDKQIILKNGDEISFDRLVLATGNQISKFPWLEATCSLQEYWQITAGKLVIVSEGNPASLSYANIACDRGIETTVVFTTNPLLAHLPSWQYFQRELSKRGIKIIDSAKINEVRGGSVVPNSLTIEVGNRLETIAFDHLLYDGATEINLPPIDGKTITILELDLQQANIIGRSDISVLGDASGLFSATEAELQAKKLARAWSSSETLNMSDFECLPLRVHGRKSLALVGSPWTLLSPGWRAVDFKVLGWSAVHNETGKLWYLYNGDRAKVEAIHICHRDASELISLAAILIDLPITDSRWLTCAVHPSAAEIFKLVIEDIETLDSETNSERVLLGASSTDNNSRDNILNLPPIAKLNHSSFYQTAFSAEERSLGILDRQPEVYFALLLGLKHLLKSQDPSGTIVLMRSSEARYFAPGLNFDYQLAAAENAIAVKLGDERVTINIGK